MHKNNPQGHSAKQNKKFMLTTAANLLPYSRRDCKKEFFWYKTEKVNNTI